MKEKKNIERLFQEKLKDFEVSPPEMAWKNIEAELNKKEKKRRIIPFWFKPTGIAASLLIGFYTFMYLNANDQIKNNPIENNINNTESENNKTLIIPQNSTVTVPKKSEKLNGFPSGVTEGEKKELINTVSKKLNQKKSDDAIVSSHKLKGDKPNSLPKRLEENSVFKNVIVQNETNNQKTVLPLNNSSAVKTEKNNPIIPVKDNSNRSVVILEKSNADITQDSSIVAKISEEVSALEQLLKEKEVGKIVEEKEKGNKWGVSTNIAPVYFNSTTNGSPINTQFSENSKSYVSTISYGAGFNYDVSKKISLRAGINSLALEYNTNDVVYTTTYINVVQDESTLSRNSNGQNIAFVDQNVAKSISPDLDAVNIQQNIGTLNQATRYIEIPLEIGYKLIDNKFGIEVIGGMSSLLLNNNSISLISNGMEMEIGKANNLNQIHFSSNVGLGFKYKFLKSFEANFNPMFKYQINTYTDNSGNFKPYFIGLYSGLSFKF